MSGARDRDSTHLKTGRNLGRCASSERMNTTEAFRGLKCVDCETVHDATVVASCPDCGESLDPDYEYDAVDIERIRDSAGCARESFSPLLPMPVEASLTAGEGDTPLVAAPRLADELDVGEVAIKDEGRNPTGSVLDRGLCLAISAAAGVADDTSVEPLAVASPGNAGQSAAAYAGRADLRSYAFVPSRCAFSNKAMINVHGGQMQVAGGRLGDAVDALDERLATDYHDLGAFATPYRHEGAKLIAFEIARDRGWDAPDAVVIPTATGELITGIAKGFTELELVGLSDTVPSIIAAQAEGCAPIAKAWHEGRERAEPWDIPDTIAGELEVPDPPGDDAAIAALHDTNGTAVTAGDDDILESAVAVAANEVLEMGGAAGVAPAGAWNLTQDDWFASDDSVVLVNTESGLKTPDVLRSHLMGRGV